MITTQNLSNPKPVRECNWTGNPIKPGETYYGQSAPETRTTDASGTVVHVQYKNRRKRKANPWTAEKRAAFAERMRNYWRIRKGGPAPAPTP